MIQRYRMKGFSQHTVCMKLYGNLIRPLCLTKVITENGVLERINKILQLLHFSYLHPNIKNF